MADSDDEMMAALMAEMGDTTDAELERLMKQEEEQLLSELNDPDLIQDLKEKKATEALKASIEANKAKLRAKKEA